MKIKSVFLFVGLLLAFTTQFINSKDRARDLGVPFSGTPGKYNAITDVPGLLVGHTTLISGSGKLEVGKGPIRTGVTAILPHGRDIHKTVAAARSVINGTGEMTGAALIDEIGQFLGPIMLTGTTSTGIVSYSTSKWIRDNFPKSNWIAGLIPIVAETQDEPLNDVFGYHVKEKHVVNALNSASSGPVAEGNVGGGTGMTAYGFKGGIGTSSRIVKTPDGEYTVGVLVQANHGMRHVLRIAGVPVGKEISDIQMEEPLSENDHETKQSLIIIIATDAPLRPQQLARLARRATLGVGRNGSVATNFSGEMALAISTTYGVEMFEPHNTIKGPSNWNPAVLTPLYEAVVDATEESIVNVLVAAETMQGANNSKLYALPHDRLIKLLKKYNRYNK